MGMRGVVSCGRIRGMGYNGVGYDVRRISAEDWREFRRLRLEALQMEPLAFVEQHETSAAEPDEFWQTRVVRGARDPSTATFVAIHNGQMVGKATGFVDSEVAEPTVHLVGVYVTPAFRGAGAGVSRAVVGAVMHWARDEMRVPRVRLFVTEANGRAAAFYRKLGFVATGLTMEYPPDPSITEFEMVNTALVSV
jgi:ribosomal protein S18 acetylase RimI-like enzyme